MAAGTQRFINRTNTGWGVVKVFVDGDTVRAVAIASYDGPGSKRQAVNRAGTNTELPDQFAHGNVKVDDVVWDEAYHGDLPEAVVA